MTAHIPPRQAGPAPHQGSLTLHRPPEPRNLPGWLGSAGSPRRGEFPAGPRERHLPMWSVFLQLPGGSGFTDPPRRLPLSGRLSPGLPGALTAKPEAGPRCGQSALFLLLCSTGGHLHAPFTFDYLIDPGVFRLLIFFRQGCQGNSGAHCPQIRHPGSSSHLLGLTRCQQFCSGSVFPEAWGGNYNALKPARLLWGLDLNSDPSGPGVYPVSPCTVL